MCQRKMKFCKNVKEMSGNFTFQPDKARMLNTDVFFWMFNTDVFFFLNP